MLKFNVFWRLFVIDYLLKKYGFKYSCELMKKQKQKIIKPQSVDHVDLKDFCFTLREICQNHILHNKALCLHQSLLAFILLSKKGIEIDLCFGVQPDSFSAHAWLEKDGIVINDDPKIKGIYQLLFKI